MMFFPQIGFIFDMYYNYNLSNLIKSFNYYIKNLKNTIVEINTALASVNTVLKRC